MYTDMPFYLRACALMHLLYVEHRPDCCSNPSWPAALIRIQQPEALQGRLADWRSAKEEREVIECVGEKQRGSAGEQSRSGRGPLLFSKHLVNDSNPIKYRVQL